MSEPYEFGYGIRSARRVPSMRVVIRKRDGSRDGGGGGGGDIVIVLQGPGTGHHLFGRFRRGSRA